MSKKFRHFLLYLYCFIFFFSSRRRHTRSDRDWSSDVCSSDLPYGIWRDVVLTNKKNVGEALLKLEQKLAHIRENLDTRGLEDEFERAHKLKKVSDRKSVV